MKTVRIIIPAFPEVNIFTRQAKKTTALGPVIVATVINKISGVRAEVIDENNYRQGPKDKNGLPDHALLQKKDPALIVGFYCGLTSTIERVWQLADFYKEKGVQTIAGGWHAHYCPEETLNHNIDVVVHGDGEIVIKELVKALLEKGCLDEIPGISFKTTKGIRSNNPSPLENKNMDNIPYPDFGLLRFAKIKIYPISRIKGCDKNCEFCSVKGKPRYASAEYLLSTVKWLVDTRKARHFFIVDDRLEQDLERTMKFFTMIFEEYGNRLSFSVQMRLEIAKNIPFLEIMKKAGVRYACIGYESPIDEDLKAMRKGYLSSNMIEWTKILHRYLKSWIHAMFIVCYPSKNIESSISPEEIVRRYRRFIRKARIHSIQIMLPIPLVGTDLRERIKEGIFSQDLVPWAMYDGNHVCFEPNNMTVKELQSISAKLMKRFYRRSSLIKIGFRTIIFPVDFLIRGWGEWHRDWKKSIINYSGYLLIKAWFRNKKNQEFIKKLEKKTK